MTKNQTPKLDSKGIIIIVLIIGILYFLSTNIVTITIGLILLTIIVIAGLYFILPLIGGSIGVIRLIGAFIGLRKIKK